MWTIIVIVLLAVIYYLRWQWKVTMRTFDWSAHVEQRLAELEWRIEHAPGVPAKQARVMQADEAQEAWLKGLREELKKIKKTQP